MAKSKPANTRATDKKRKAPRTAWKKGQSGNPRGAPKRGESWAELIHRVGQMTPGEAAAQSLALAEKLLSIGEGVTLKEAVVLRVYADLLFQPDARMFVALMERAEGKLTDTLRLGGEEGRPVQIGVVAIDYKHLLAPLSPGPMVHLPAPREDEILSDGATVGKNGHGK